MTGNRHGRMVVLLPADVPWGSHSIPLFHLRNGGIVSIAGVLPWSAVDLTGDIIAFLAKAFEDSFFQPTLCKVAKGLDLSLR